MPAFKSLLVLQYILLSFDIAHVNAQSSSSAASGSASASASACASIAPQHAAPSVAAGWRAQVVANGLSNPRGIMFDGEALLVVEQDRGITRLRLNEESGSCVRVDGDPELIIDDATLNHGIELSDDGSTLYASSPTGVFAWDYDASTGRNTSGPRELIASMGSDDGHSSRTLLLSRQVPGLLLVSRGSLSNLDPMALDIDTGVSTIKAYNVTNNTDSVYNFAEDGLLLGWGLRNSVGVAEDPITGGIYSVENSVDNFERSGQDIHENNPGEEMNFHGYLNGTEFEDQGGNYGYPSCYAAWDVGEIPDNEGIDVGTQFAIGDQNATVNDTFCRENRVAPRLTFPGHLAPLDMKFNDNGTAAWVTFHGSWNREEPIGYKLAVIAFDGNGSPVEPSNSNSSAIDVVSNPDVSVCPDECFRPVGLAWDSQGRLFFSSDSTGEIYVVVREDGGSANEASPTSGLPEGNAAETAPTSSSTPGAAAGLTVSGIVAVWAGIMALPLI